MSRSTTAQRIKSAFTLRSRSLLLPTLLACLVSACASNLPQPTTSDAARAEGAFAGISLTELEQGRSLYVARCGSCHTLRDPTSQPAATWSREVHEMRTKNGVAMTNQEEHQISAYLFAVASR